ncbi:MAG TPA: hypothetical protein VF263_00145 [Longimicrobiaceae bacterium]
MPRSSSPLHGVSAALQLFAGLITAPLGFVGFFSDAGPMRPVWGMMAVASLLLLGSGVWAFVQWRRATVVEAGHQAALHAAVSPPAAAAEVPEAREAPEARVLAHWTYGPGQWTTYTGTEIAFRKREAVYQAAGITALGTVFLSLGDDISLGHAFQSSAFVGIMVFAGRYLQARAAHDSNAATARGEAIISPDAVVLNGRYHVLRNDEYHLRSVRYLDAGATPLLEFSVEWRTRGGPASEEIHVPVPPGREGEARELARTFPVAARA